MSDDGREHVGSVTEEAVKLLGALQGWAQDSAGDASGTAGSAASAASGVLHDLNEHLATGSQDCRYCPVCQVIAAVRETSPEVKQHLATAATSLMRAAAGFLEGHGQPGSDRSDPPRDRRDPVEKIDLSDDTDDTGWEE